MRNGVLISGGNHCPAAFNAVKSNRRNGRKGSSLSDLVDDEA
jgi:hypothetical protein